MTFARSGSLSSLLLLLLVVPLLRAGDHHHDEHHHEEHDHDGHQHAEHHSDEHDHVGRHGEQHHDEHHEGLDDHDRHHRDKHDHHDEHHHGHDHHDEHQDDHHHDQHRHVEHRHEHGNHHHDSHREHHHKEDHHQQGAHVHRLEGLRDQGWLGAYLSAIGMSAVSFVGVIFLAIFGGKSQLEAMAEYVCLAFAGTTLVADALLHLLPHAFEGASHDAMTIAGLAAVVGALSVLAVPEMCSHSHSHSHEGGHDAEVTASGWANLFVEMLHNFVDGISIGLSWMAGPSAGLGASLAVAVHELPQELGDFVVLRTAGFSTKRLLFWNFLASLTCVGGVGVAHFFGQEASLLVQRNLMGFTAGSFLTLALNMIFPQVSESIRHHHKGRSALLAKLLCLFVSCLSIFILVKIGNLEGHDHEHGDSHGHSHGHAHGHHNHTEL